MGATSDLAGICSQLTYGDLPAPVVEAARCAILDGLGNILAGSRQPLARPYVDHVVSWGGNDGVTVAGYPRRTDAKHAAFLHGIFCHALDFEVMWTPPTHPTSPTLPVAMALAEAQGPVSGRDLITALAAGFEFQGRLNRAIVATGRPWPHGFHPPGLLGPFGAATVAGRLLGLSAEQLATAYGIAGSRTGALLANIGTMTKASHSGNAARMGLESALLAGCGVTARQDILEGRNGISEAYFDGELDLDPTVRLFGNPFLMVDPGLAMKKYPSQFPTHWSIEAAIGIREQPGFRADDVESVTVEVGADNESANIGKPETGLAGKFSLVYTVSAALLDGRVGIETFTDARLAGADIQAMMDRISVSLNPAVKAMDFTSAWSEVVVTTRSGERLARRVDRPLGIWDNPMPWSGWVDKFRECAAQTVDDATAGKILHEVERLEDLDDFAPVVRLMATA